MNEVYRYRVEPFRCDVSCKLWELIKRRFGFGPVECSSLVLGYSLYISEQNPSCSADIFQLILISSTQKPFFKSASSKSRIAILKGLIEGI